jgi:DNA-directed RNA polymerase specialized sigma24 family protein
MRLTEKDFAEYFPKSNRFLHFCAKYYGMSFHNDEVVEEASFQALKNVMRMYNRGQEFENEAEKTGMVMSCFRFGILNAYSQMDRRNRLDCRAESEVTYGYGDDEYSKYQASLISHDKPYDNLHSLLLEFVDNHLSRVERIVVLENILGDKTYKMMSNEHDLSMNVLRSARERALNKLRKYVSRITSTEHTKTQTTNQSRYISESRSKLRIKTLLESIAKEQEERDRYSSALSFVYLDE